MLKVSIGLFLVLLGLAGLISQCDNHDHVETETKQDVTCLRDRCSLSDY